MPPNVANTEQEGWIFTPDFPTDASFGRPTSLSSSQLDLVWLSLAGSDSSTGSSTNSVPTSRDVSVNPLRKCFHAGCCPSRMILSDEELWSQIHLTLVGRGILLNTRQGPSVATPLVLLRNILAVSTPVYISGSPQVTPEQLASNRDVNKTFTNASTASKAANSSPRTVDSPTNILCPTHDREWTTPTIRSVWRAFRCF